MQLFNSDKEFVQDLAKQIHRAGGAVYYVGGYVRDQILGKPNKDIDIEVHNIKQEKLKIILQNRANHLVFLRLASMILILLSPEEKKKLVINIQILKLLWIRSWVLRKLPKEEILP